VARIRLVIVVIIAALAAATAAVGAPRGSTVTLTLWHNYGTDNDAVALHHLIAAFEKTHPTIKINAVSEPGSNYFALVQAAAISHTGPDLSVQWTGLFDLKYEKFLVNLNKWFTPAQIARIDAAPYMAPNFQTSKGLLVMPESSDFYIGFYNKKLFKQAGISSPPTDWSQLQADCTKLKKINVTPMEYGLTSGLVLGSSFYPWYDVSYLMAGVFSPTQWRNLYDGKTPWTSPTVTAQLDKWAHLRSSGCTNSDVLTAANILGKLAQGKAAMIVDGTWDMGTLRQQMGSNLGVFVPPYSTKPMHRIILYPGQGYAIMKDSKHQTEAAEFLKFLFTPQASKIIDGAGLVPPLKGTTTANPITNQLLGLIKNGYVTYPMLDNIVQPEVVTAGEKELVAAFAGTISVQSALKNLQDTLLGLPASRRGTTYTGG
jgi:ABC-type glycerol-3-phosphate transport system substrate-binding protein